MLNLILTAALTMAFGIAADTAAGTSFAHRDMPTHRFEARVVWRAGAAGIAAGDHGIEFSGRPPIEVSATPQ